ncbi:MAG: tRNA lysidine(34) synthetase TilS [Brevundimonas sp.]|uniref:tRNA lysidine(34) synthetase TilS n=1 Tax=Brevundimonas sp. TaxID=1871086 RepID=UPI00403433C8
MTPADSALTERVRARLDARLSGGIDAPVLIPLSGGGDSMALLGLAADWARARARRLVAVTIDHGLNPDSPVWSRRCRTAAEALGLDWIGRRWEGEKPTTGLTATARAARHALIAGVAHEVGAHVILTGHTADDVAEADWMRARSAQEGVSPLGRLRDWSPSPVWPEGRGLMLLRPLLTERRAALRDLLRSLGQDWIEDPANLDPRFGRSRARRALEDAPDATAPLAFASARSEALTTPIRPLPFGLGFETGRDLPPAALSAMLVSASGGQALPRGERLAALARRLASGEDFTVTLSGARIEGVGEHVRVAREPGEMRRRSVAPVPLSPGVAAVWDGRVEAVFDEPGWRLTGAHGLLNRLSDADRAALSALPAPVRGAAPVLIRDGGDAPVLAGRVGRVRFLPPRRLNLALSGFGLVFPGETTQEHGLFDGVHGETPTTDLFSVATDEPAPPLRAPQDRKPR